MRFNRPLQRCHKLHMVFIFSLGRHVDCLIRDIFIRHVVKFQPATVVSPLWFNDSDPHIDSVHRYSCEAARGFTVPSLRNHPRRQRILRIVTESYGPVRIR